MGGDVRRRIRETPRHEVISEVNDPVAQIRRWGEARDWRGYDPYDALNSPFVPYLTLGTAFGRRVLTQVVKRLPSQPPTAAPHPACLQRQGARARRFGLRAACGRARRRQRRRGRAPLARWLVSDAVVDGVGLAWGYHFDVRPASSATRRGRRTRSRRRSSPTRSSTASSSSGRARFGDAAREAASFLVDHMLDNDEDSPFFRYVQEERELVHNANLLACSVVVRTSALRDEPLDERVAAAVATSVEAQRADGSWPYAAGPVGRLGRQLPHGLRARVARALRGDWSKALDPALQRGFDYWERELFLPDGEPEARRRAAASRSMRTTMPRRSRPGSPSWRRDGALERAVARPSSWSRACSTRAARELPARQIRDEPRPVRPLDDRARLPRACADSSCPRGARR